MSYEEIDRAAYGNDIFTNGAEGRYTKPKDSVKKKKQAPKAPAPESADVIEQIEEVRKTKKKSRKTPENEATANEEQSPEAGLSMDGEPVVKPKKKRAPKVESNIENIDPIPAMGEEAPVKKKKSRAPKGTPIEEDFQMLDNPPIDESERTIKVKRPKKPKIPKTTTDTFEKPNEYSINSDFNNDGAYGLTALDASYDALPAHPMEAEQNITDPQKSEYEAAIIDAYSNLASKMNFVEFVGSDQWCIIHPPKSARPESKSRIRKILPGSHPDKPSGAKTTNQKGGFLDRFRSGVKTLVRDENNLLFGEGSNYDLAYYDTEEDGVDTDNLHRYAQKLRELEDTDREVNPEFLVLRDGKTVYAVHEADEEGKMTLATRKPIYDRSHDQTPEHEESGKKNFLARLRRNPFARNKDKDSKGISSPKSADGTPEITGKRRARKSNNKTTDDDMATVLNNEPLGD